MKILVQSSTLKLQEIIEDCRNNWEQARAELCQAQVKLEVVVEIGVEVEACHYKPKWVVDGGWVGGLKPN